MTHTHTHATGQGQGQWFKRVETDGLTDEQVDGGDCITSSRDNAIGNSGNAC